MRENIMNRKQYLKHFTFDSLIGSRFSTSSRWKKSPSPHNPIKLCKTGKNPVGNPGVHTAETRKLRLVRAVCYERTLIILLVRESKL